jgi:hypothetical protein
LKIVWHIAFDQMHTLKHAARQQSSALALGIVIATNPSANNAAVDAVVIPKSCFIFFLAGLHLTSGAYAPFRRMQPKTITISGSIERR